MREGLASARDRRFTEASEDSARQNQRRCMNSHCARIAVDELQALFPYIWVKGNSLTNWLTPAGPLPSPYESGQAAVACVRLGG